MLAPLLMLIVFLAPRASEPQGTTAMQASPFGDAGTAASMLRASGAALADASAALTVFGPPAAAGASTPVASAFERETQQAPIPVEGRTPSSEETGTGEAMQQSLPIFFEHEVQDGDTVTGIAARYGIASDYIVWNNVDILDDADALAIGVVLQVPSVGGMIHSVRVGETVSEIAELYDAEIDGIVEFAANGFNGNPDNVQEGSLILVPGGRPLPPAPPVAEPTPEATPEATPEPTVAPEADEPATPPEAEPAPEPETAAPASSVPAGWLWPATGRITNFFTARHPLGLDISMVVGTPLVAASGGQAVFVGGNPCCSYGSHVIIDHGNGYESVYAHLSQFAVSNGEWVAAGQLIGWSGSTGRSTGPHLHFEIRKNGVHRDPILYLP